MKVSKRNVFCVILVMSTIFGEKSGQEKAEENPMDWYTKWVESQEKPYVRTGVIEGKLIFYITRIVCKILGRK